MFNATTLIEDGDMPLKFSTARFPFATELILELGYTGADQIIIVPPGMNYIQPFAWGAGGGGGFHTASSNGGAGGYASAILQVVPSESLTIIIGQRGFASEEGFGNTTPPVSRYGGGGNPCGYIGRFVGYGGGLTGIKRTLSNQWLLIAGGGGGGGISNLSHGGAGGGTTGASGGNSGASGGSQTNGGAGATSGGQFQGGNAPAEAYSIRPGGGSGWWGGGSPASWEGLGGAGGGSGYIFPDSTSASLIAGSGTTPGNSGSSFRPSGVGVGGFGNTSPGGHGYMRLRLFKA